jgi:DNA-directed RNA polymerase subunit RPC12/RpoP
MSESADDIREKCWKCRRLVIPLENPKVVGEHRRCPNCHVRIDA